MPVEGARYALIMLTIVYAFNFIDRQILVILQEPIKLEMGLSDAQLGLLSGFSFVLVYITAGIPIAYWADRSNRRNIITAALAIWSGMTALAGFAQNYGLLLAVLFSFTVGEPQRGRWESAEDAAYRPGLKETLRTLASFRSFWLISAGGGMAGFVGYGSGNFAPSFLMRIHDLGIAEVGIVLAVAMNTCMGPCLAIAHTLVPPAMRALTSAVFLFVINLIGLGLGPLTAGLLSDWLTDLYGFDGLRYAMLIVGICGLPAMLLFYLAARALPADLARGQTAT